jgi:hypothetical protein
MNVYSLFPSKYRDKLNKLVEKKATTKGNIIASSYRFVNFYEIDFVFSNLLKMNSFLDYLIKLNYINQTSSIYGHPIAIEYEDIANAYAIRNEIAHGIKSLNIAKSKLIAFWDNLINMMDICQTVFSSVENTELRASLDDDYEFAKNKIKNKAIHKICSYNIFLLLHQLGGMSLGSDFSIRKIGALNEYEQKMIRENSSWVIPRMIREKVISNNDNRIIMTALDRNRFKKTSVSEKLKWKRNASDIICTWSKINGD